MSRKNAARGLMAVGESGAHDESAAATHEVELARS
jgi:hypothetical protein